ncbi:MAG: YhbY family RNA-binding protein, partial [Desulfuromonadales bacterium]
MLPHTPRPLTGKQNRYLRGLGHKLRPVVMIGKHHMSEEVIRATDEALVAHELIKVRIQ